MAQHLDDLVFAVLLAPWHRTRDDYYHLEVAVVSWDLAASRVHLKANATPNNREHESLRGRTVTYDLKKHVVTPEYVLTWRWGADEHALPDCIQAQRRLYICISWRINSWRNP